MSRRPSTSIGLSPTEKKLDIAPSPSPLKDNPEQEKQQMEKVERASTELMEKRLEITPLPLPPQPGSAKQKEKKSPFTELMEKHLEATPPQQGNAEREKEKKKNTLMEIVLSVRKNSREREVERKKRKEERKQERELGTKEKKKKEMKVSRFMERRAADRVPRRSKSTNDVAGALLKENQDAKDSKQVKLNVASALSFSDTPALFSNLASEPSEAGEPVTSSETTTTLPMESQLKVARLVIAYLIDGFIRSQGTELLLRAVCQKRFLRNTLTGNETYGVFRVPGDADEVTYMKECMQRGELKLSTMDPFVLASALLGWLRDLPEPLIPFSC